MEQAVTATKQPPTLGFSYLTVYADATHLTRAPSRCNEASLCISSGSTAACAQSECTVWKRDSKPSITLYFSAISHKTWKYLQNQQLGNRQTQSLSKEEGVRGFRLLKGSNTYKGEERRGMGLYNSFSSTWLDQLQMQVCCLYSINTFHSLLPLPEDLISSTKGIT